MKKQIILSIIYGVVIFAFGAGLGIFYQMQQPSSQTPQQLESQIESQKLQIQSATLLKTLSSKVIPLYAAGTVTNINGADITLSSEGSALVIPVSNTASINLFTQPAGGKNPYYQSVQFSDIKMGDRLNINLSLSPDYKLQGQAVYISRPVPGEKTKGS